MTAIVHTGDAIVVLRTLPSDSAHCCVTDPPYGERAASWDSPKTQEWHEEWLREAARVVVDNGPFLVFGSRRYLDFLMAAMRKVLGDSPARPLQTGVWVHRQGHPVAEGMLRPEHEPFVVSGKLRTTAIDVRRLRSYQSPHNLERKPTCRRSGSRGFKSFTYVPDENGPMAGTVIEAARNKPAEATGHPTQKAEAVMVPAVLLAAAPGEFVLDPFAGSGTTGVVAVRHGRGFVGIERNEGYADVARARITAEAPLFVRALPAPRAAQASAEVLPTNADSGRTLPTTKNSQETGT